MVSCRRYGSFVSAGQADALLRVQGVWRAGPRSAAVVARPGSGCAGRACCRPGLCRAQRGLLCAGARASSCGSPGFGGGLGTGRATAASFGGGVCGVACGVPHVVCRVREDTLEDGGECVRVRAGTQAFPVSQLPSQGQYSR